MAIRDVEVVITRETRAVTQAGFGTPMILATNKNFPYTTFTELSAVAEQFDPSTRAYQMANRIFGQTPRPVRLGIYGVEFDPETDSVNELIAELNKVAEKDFYFLLCDRQEEDVILALSQWIDAQRKLYFYDTDDPTIHETIESDRTIPFVHKNPLSFPAAGWVGVCAPQDPGSITWKFKTISGIEDPGYSTAEVDAIVESGGNTYVRQGGILHTYDGRTSSGEWIDVMRSMDFVEARIKEEVFRVLVNSPKVRYDSIGIAQIVSAVESVLKTAFNQGIIAVDDDGQPMYTVTAPKRSEIPANMRAQRILPDVNFTFTLAGAVHKVRIRGVIQV